MPAVMSMRRLSSIRCTIWSSGAEDAGLDQAAPLVGWQLPDCSPAAAPAGIPAWQAWQPRVHPGLAAAGDICTRTSDRRGRRRSTAGNDQLRRGEASVVVPHRARPPRLDMENWPHLPLARVRTTKVADYMVLLPCTPAGTPHSDAEVTL